MSPIVKRVFPDPLLGAAITILGIFIVQLPSVKSKEQTNTGLPALSIL